jgi:hypothetical protein
MALFIGRFGDEFARHGERLVALQFNHCLECFFAGVGRNPPYRLREDLQPGRAAITKVKKKQIAPAKNLAIKLICSSRKSALV